MNPLTRDGFGIPFVVPFVLVCATLAGTVLYLATATYGAGVSSDSIFYLSGADSLLQGRGYTDFQNQPIIDFPPLYSLTLAVFSAPFGISTFIAGRILNILIVIALFISTGWMLAPIFAARPLGFYLSLLALTVLMPLYALAANIGSDLLYTLISAWFCIAAQHYLQKQTVQWLIIMVVLAMLAPMLRWAGIALIVAQAILVFFAHWKDWRQAFLRTVLATAMAALPVTLWMVLFNLPHGQLMGGVGIVDMPGNLRLSALRISEWLGPYPEILVVVLALVTLLPAFALNRHRDNWLRWLKNFFTPAFFPVVVLHALYFAAVITNTYTLDHLDPSDHRYQVPMAAVIFAVFFISFELLILSPLAARTKRYAQFSLLLGFSVWMAYQALQVYRFTVISRVQGVQQYNVYNTKAWLRSGLVVQLIQTPPPADALIYSNEPEAVYFFLRRPAFRSLYDPQNYTADTQRIAEYLQGWSFPPQAYWVWFKPNIKRHYYSPQMLENWIQMEKIYRSWDGEMYLISPLP